MGDATLKPSSGDDLVLSNDDGSAKIEVNENGTIITTGLNQIQPSSGQALALKEDGGTTILSITTDGDVMIDDSAELFVKGTGTTADRVKLENDGGSGKITVKNSSGTETITLSGGSGLITGTTFSGSGVITLAETWRLNGSTSMGTTHGLKNWVITGGDYGSTSMNIDTSTGTITPPSTGFYIISVSAMVYNDTNSTPRYVEISHRFNSGSGNVEYLRATSNIADAETGHYTQITSNFIYDWTSTSTTLQLICVAEENVSVNGTTNKAFTTATFMKIGDT